LNYSLPDGSTAGFAPLDLRFSAVAPGIYKVESMAEATTTDGLGRTVTLSDVTLNIYTVTCHQPRGTCPPQKKFQSGSITVVTTQ
jgi:hypothetical protein